MGRRDTWLSLTPEPERELPAALAVLGAGDEERERRRVERLVVHGGNGAWLRYMRRALDLAEAGAGSRDPDVTEARATVVDVVRNHHMLLLGLPGRAAERTAGERARLEAIDNGGAP
jgi:hypothetical protein